MLLVKQYNRVFIFCLFLFVMCQFAFLFCWMIMLKLKLLKMTLHWINSRYRNLFVHYIYLLNDNILVYHAPKILMSCFKTCVNLMINVKERLYSCIFLFIFERQNDNQFPQLNLSIVAWQLNIPANFPVDLFLNCLVR